MTYTIVYIYRKRYAKAVFFLLLCICGFMFFGSDIYEDTSADIPVFNELDTVEISYQMHFANVETYYRRRQLWPSSTLGGIMFKRNAIADANLNENKTFVVLVWKHWDWLKKRHVYNFGAAKDSQDNGLADCSVNNCIFSGDDKLIDTADAVLVHLQRGVIPQVEKRNLSQRWVFLNDEAPKNAFSLSKQKWSPNELENVFNWSMTYRSDADVPVPYGRTVGLDTPIMESFELSEISAIVPNWDKKRRDVSATVLMSNCGVKARNDFLNTLRKYMTVDVYGACSDKLENKNRCPGHFKADCEPVSRYLFYLVLENSNCFQYLTEKIFYHAYEKGAVPIIWGPSREDCETLLPPNSYFYVDRDTNIEVLAKDIATLTNNEELYLSMHMWRNNFKVVNEHGYFGSKSYHLCRLCEALNYNDKSVRIYSKADLNGFLNPSLTCEN